MLINLETQRRKNGGTTWHLSVLGGLHANLNCLESPQAWFTYRAVPGYSDTTEDPTF
jgi:hypothetical protein